MEKLFKQPLQAGMAKLVDALDLGSSGATHRSSSLLTRTIFHSFCADNNWAIGDYAATRSGTERESVTVKLVDALDLGSMRNP